jgi:hypothetical protein
LILIGIIFLSTIVFQKRVFETGSAGGAAFVLIRVHSCPFVVAWDFCGLACRKTTGGMEKGFANWQRQNKLRK